MPLRCPELELRFGGQVRCQAPYVVAQTTRRGLSRSCEELTIAEHAFIRRDEVRPDTTNKCLLAETDDARRLQNERTRIFVEQEYRRFQVQQELEDMRKVRHRVPDLSNSLPQ